MRGRGNPSIQTSWEDIEILGPLERLQLRLRLVLCLKLHRVPMKAQGIPQLILRPTKISKVFEWVVQMLA